jgi:uncharacterized protein (DUF1810 family)
MTTRSSRGNVNNLERFVNAQNDHPIEQVFSELENGAKVGHWMWYIFPQVEGLGESATSEEFAIFSLAEAKAYLAHPLLGARLRKCSELVNKIRGRTVEEIFQYPDNLKFRSSMTLFAHVTSENRVFLEAIRKYFGEKFDPLTTKWLANRMRDDKK